MGRRKRRFCRVTRPKSSWAGDSLMRARDVLRGCGAARNKELSHTCTIALQNVMEWRFRIKGHVDEVLGIAMHVRLSHRVKLANKQTNKHEWKHNLSLNFIGGDNKYKSTSGTKQTLAIIYVFLFFMFSMSYGTIFLPRYVLPPLTTCLCSVFRDRRKVTLAGCPFVTYCELFLCSLLWGH